jgi:hypothetical protein
MSYNDQLIKVAELDGWRPNGAGFWHKNGQVCSLFTFTTDGCGGIGEDIERLPRYLDDLNVMHITESHMSEAQTYRMADKLVTILSKERGINHFIHRANAAQRAEAFVLVMEPE